MGKIAKNSKKLYGFFKNFNLFGDDKNLITNSHAKNKLQANSILFKIGCGTVFDSRSLRVKLLFVAISYGTRKCELVDRTKEIIDTANINTDSQKNIYMRKNKNKVIILNLKKKIEKIPGHLMMMFYRLENAK
jgi:hypothetical protein